MDAIHGDAVAAELHRERPRQVNERGVPRPAAQVPGDAGVAAADVDDPPPARRAHVGDRGAGEAERPQVLDVEVMEQVVVDNGVDVSDRGGRSAGMGPAVDEDVEPPERFDGPFDGAVDVVPLRDVAGERDDLASRFAGRSPPPPLRDPGDSSKRARCRRPRGRAPSRLPGRSRGSRPPRSPSCLPARGPWCSSRRCPLKCALLQECRPYDNQTTPPGAAKPVHDPRTPRDRGRRTVRSRIPRLRTSLIFSPVRENLGSESQRSPHLFCKGSLLTV